MTQNKDMGVTDVKSAAELPNQPVRLAPIVALGSATLALPAPLTSFVGRAAEVATVGGLLRRDDVRLVTLTGPGGVGKTRLALEVAAAESAEFADGVCFVPLASIGDPGLVLSIVAQALGVQEADDQPVAARLATFLRRKELLLVLDNFEQVLPTAAPIVALLAECPGLKVLVTSRAVLHVSGEHDLPIPPLAVPAPFDPDHPPPVEEVARCDAIQLFVERARAAKPDFALTEANAAVVVEICHLLDGLPLAIELAAARIRALSPPVLLARLSHRLTVLTGGPRDVPPRLRTMRDAIAWSYDLLAPREQRLFRWLAVFVGGFTLDAVEWVMGDGSWVIGDDETAPADPSVLEALSALVDHSLLLRVEPADGELRFAMLETIREYARERLAASGEEAAARRRHAAWCLQFAEQSWRATRRGMAPTGWLDRLEAEHDNVRAALNWLAETGAAGTSLRLAGALAPLWKHRSHRREGRRWLERALAATRHRRVSASARARALEGAAGLAFSEGDHERATAHGEESLRLHRELGDVWGAGAALNLLGAVARGQGDYERATALLEDGLALLRQAEQPEWIALACCNLGILAYRRGESDQAAAILHQALALFREADNSWGMAVALSDLALVTGDGGNLAAAAAAYAESLAWWRVVGTKEGLADWLARVAVLATACRQPERAARLFGTAAALSELVGYAFELPEAERHERAARAARAELGEATFAAAVAAGRMLPLDEALAEALLVAPAAPDDRASGPAPLPAAETDLTLTRRERDVLRLLVDGRSDREIAAALFVTRSTVSKHVMAILAKLEVSSRTAAATVAVRRSLV